MAVSEALRALSPVPDVEPAEDTLSGANPLPAPSGGMADEERSTNTFTWELTGTFLHDDPADLEPYAETFPDEWKKALKAYFYHRDHYRPVKILVA